MPLQPYHTGIIVEDLTAAIPAWEAATGRQWGAPYRGPVTVRTPDDDRTTTVEIAMAYSLDLGLELVQRIPGTCWDVAGGTGVHHTGCWADDLVADSERLEADGWPVVAHAVGEDGRPAMFTYHQVPGIGLLELVDPATREMLEAMVRGQT
jgi:hypothetical protein